MSREGQSVMRRLDVVTVKGSEVPIGIYTYDALQDQFFKEDRCVQTLLFFFYYFLNGLIFCCLRYFFLRVVSWCRNDRLLLSFSHYFLFLVLFLFVPLFLCFFF